MGSSPAKAAEKNEDQLAKANGWLMLRIVNDERSGQQLIRPKQGRQNRQLKSKFSMSNSGPTNNELRE